MQTNLRKILEKTGKIVILHFKIRLDLTPMESRKSHTLQNQPMPIGITDDDLERADDK